MPKIPSDAIDKYFGLQLGLMKFGQLKLDNVMPSKYIRKLNDPDYRLKKYQQQVRDHHSAATEDASQSEWYQYAGLEDGQIRLLHILPGPDGSSIECKLVTRSFNDADPFHYEALSYTWGDPSVVQYISCDGKTLQVTVNLWTALHHIRHTSEEKVMWIDAVCINQGDIDERSSQVRMMEEIYRRASIVVVWLGDGGPEVTEAWNLMQRLDESKRKIPPNQIQIWHNELADYGLPPANAPEWETLDALLWRPWFVRIWIVQEITLARDAVVFCGNETIPWDKFLWIIWFLRLRNLEGTYNLDVSPAFRLGILGSAHRSGRPLPLLELLGLFRRSLATDPHDKVYGLLGLAASHEVEIDYKIPYSQLYLDVAKSIMKESLDILSHVEDTNWKDGTDMPSWVPNWAVQRYAAPFLTLDQRFGHAFQANGKTSPSFRFGADGRVLITKGIILDFVSAVGHRLGTSDRIYRPDHNRMSGKPLEAAQPLLHTFQTKRMRFCELLILNLKTYPTGEDIRSVLARIMVLDAKIRVPRRLYDETAQEGAEDELDLAKTYPMWRSQFATFPFESSRVPEDGSQKQEAAMAMAYQQGVSWPAGGRRVFTTKNGYAGWGPWGMGRGDAVVLFEGGRTAYILREVSNAARKVPGQVETYEFRGEAYLHGFMNGEGFSGDYKSEEFHIV
ncbi:unnamed protein product [Clonostachys rhizophaga]|uniref:Heterokaryon incompatibility domain-containing protein n=1 Tax=Clonostachys rhizophaga TaxID=160324 RepID=A0A9N9VWF0_9HYPO|nr:unnamed protein product [Clonostachys rhizophaga]